MLSNVSDNCEDALKGRVFDISLADLNNDSKEQSWRKIKLQIEETKNEDCYTSFYGMDMTRDKLCFIVNKWHSTIETFVDVKTKDGYLINIQAIAFTQRRKTQLKATCYATSSQQKQIREKIREIMIAAATKSSLKDLAVTFMESGIEKAIARQCNKIFPLKDVYVKKMSIIKKPKITHAQLMDLYSDKPSDNLPAKKTEEVEGNLLEGEAKE